MRKKVLLKGPILTRSGYGEQDPSEAGQICLNYISSRYNGATHHG